jgi:hypothetical protein
MEGKYEKIAISVYVVVFIFGLFLGAGCVWFTHLRNKGDLIDEVARLNSELELRQREIIETVNGIKENNRILSNGLGEVDAGLGQAVDGSKAIAEHIGYAGELSTDIVGTTERVREDYKAAIGIIKRLIEEEQNKDLGNSGGNGPDSGRDNYNRN